MPQKKSSGSSRNSKNIKPLKSAPRATTPVRNSSIPKTRAVAAKPVGRPAAVTYEMIAQRAYEIWQSGSGGSEFDNWVRAERELRGF